MFENKNLFIETQLLNWEDVFQLSDKLFSQLIFRGQADKDWMINSSLERLIERLHPKFIDKGLIPSQEQQMIREFQWKYPLFKEKKITHNNFVEWLSIMQHYGAATRFIDFTDSFFVALFISIFEASKDSVIWALNKHLLTADTFSLYRKKFDTNSVSKQRLDEFSLELGNEAIKNSFLEEKKGLLMIRPKNINERLYRQQGLFVMQTNIQVTFMENLLPSLSSKLPLNIPFEKLVSLSDTVKQDQFSLIKINIPKSTHLLILRELRQMNINSEMLFPGIEGLAKSLNYSKFNNLR